MCEDSNKLSQASTQPAATRAIDASVRAFAAAMRAAQAALWRASVARTAATTAALVLSSPALAADTSAVQKLLLAVAGRLAPGLAVHNGLQPTWVSRDPAVVRAYVADPLVHDRITPRLGRFVLDGGAQVRALAARWRVPTLLLWAGADRCVAPAGSAAFAAAAPAAVVQHRCFDGLAHEIFNEPERERVLKRLGDWLRVRFDTATAPARIARRRPSLGSGPKSRPANHAVSDSAASRRSVFERCSASE